MSEKKKVIITGGAGLLGSAVTHQIVESGEYLPVVMGRSDNPKRILDIMDQVIYEQGDVGDPVTLERVISIHRPEKIYHFATVLGDACETQIDLATKVNVDGFIHMIELVRKYDVAQLLFSSSLTTFGLNLESKTVDDHCLQRPGSYYGVTKLFQEGAGRFFRNKHGVDFRAIRYPAIIGPGSRAGGFVSYTSDIINYALKGEPYTVKFKPDIKVKKFPGSQILLSSILPGNGIRRRELSPEPITLINFHLHREPVFSIFIGIKRDNRINLIFVNINT